MYFYVLLSHTQLLFPSDPQLIQMLHRLPSVYSEGTLNTYMFNCSDIVSAVSAAHDLDHYPCNMSQSICVKPECYCSFSFQSALFPRGLQSESNHTHSLYSDTLEKIAKGPFEDNATNTS